MTRQIWKYDLDVVDEQSFKMPGGAQLLTVQVQHGQPRLWALVDPFAPARPYRTIFIHGTGHPVDPRARVYIASFQMHGGDLVFHVFDGGER